MVAAAPTTVYTGTRKALITATLCTGPVMQVLDSSVIAVSLNHMQGSLSAAQDQMAWVLTSYLMALAVATPLWGVLVQRFSRKNMFNFSIVCFALTSLLCGTADSLTELLIFRAIQGVFGAALIPLSQAALMDIYDPKDYGIAMGWWGVGLMFGPVFGPTLGGYLTDLYSWRWAFFINVPLGVVSFIAVWAFVPQTVARRQRPFNYMGYIALAIGLGCVQFVLDRGQRYDWFESTTIITLLCIGGGAFWVFIVNSLTSKHPFIDPTILRNPNFAIGLVLRAVFGILLFGALILIPPFLQKIAGYPVVEAGLMMAPRGLATMVSAIAVGRLVKDVDPRLIIIVGALLAGFSSWEMAQLTPDAPGSTILVLILIQGVGTSCFFVPLNSLAFAELTRDQLDQGASFFALMGNIGRSIGIAILSSYLVYGAQMNKSLLVEQATPYNDLLSHVPNPGFWSFDTMSGLARLNAELARQAEVIAYVMDFQLLAAMLFACIPLVLVMRIPRAVKSPQPA
ncbi:MAG: DHA2 family efflux MFS transporter permease subunit [Rhodospirillaceae bacterium]|jgi:MFS transporter, DHA2 family, multidrug resistance protein|nr:DHA2 family efflux MFS transporter permease subunit [Rhodospirillaceae bacterium]